jgi:glycerol-3-phosphate acyltransferase PlsY
MPTIILVALLSYLIGSIPFGYLLVRTVRGADIREFGSGNIGATNVARTSPALGVLTLILDALKGSAAVLVAMQISHSLGAPAALSFTAYWQCVLAAFFAVVGHVFPVWLRFRGGKGVATGLGSFVLLAPRAVLVMIAVFIRHGGDFPICIAGFHCCRSSLPLACMASSRLSRVRSRVGDHGNYGDPDCG